MIILWIITGAMCGLLSLLLRMQATDYGNLVTGLAAWALFGLAMVLITRRKANSFQSVQFVGGTALAGTMIMVLGMLPFGAIFLFPGGEAVSRTVEFAYLARAVGGAISGLALYYLWKASEPVRPTVS